MGPRKKSGFPKSDSLSMLAKTTPTAKQLNDVPTPTSTSILRRHIPTTSIAPTTTTMKTTRRRDVVNHLIPRLRRPLLPPPHLLRRNGRKSRHLRRRQRHLSCRILNNIRRNRRCATGIDPHHPKIPRAEVTATVAIPLHPTRTRTTATIIIRIDTTKNRTTFGTVESNL